MQKHHLLTCSAISIVMTSAFALPAYAQLQDEVIVTATKRSESASDIPIAVSALGEETLDELRVNVFTDYLVQLPGVSAGGAGPGTIQSIFAFLPRRLLRPRLQVWRVWHQTLPFIWTSNLSLNPAETSMSMRLI